jgi:DNA-directed RNA polymerase specialized sigma24 family protein
MERPPRHEVEEAAVALVARHGPKVLATARRYAATPEDADDAYQRGLEILLTKAPTTSEVELLAWLKTVVLRTICSSPCWKQEGRGFGQISKPCSPRIPPVPG